MVERWKPFSDVNILVFLSDGKKASAHICDADPKLPRKYTVPACVLSERRPSEILRTATGFDRHVTLVGLGSYMHTLGHNAVNVRATLRLLTAKIMNGQSGRDVKLILQ